MKKPAATRKGVAPQGENKKRPAATPRGMSPKQIRFVDEYLVDLNAAGAARRAGYAQKRADAIGYDLLRNPEVQSAIAAKQKELASKVGVTRERILEEMARIAFADLRGIFDENGNLKPIPQLTDGQAAAISSIEVEGPTKQNPMFVTKVKLWNKGPQLENLLKHLGMDDPNKQPAATVAVPNIDKLRARLEALGARVAS